MSDPTHKRRRVRLFISGRVQGVWYRGSMQRKAKSRALTGWVRNLPDGRVEASVEGEPAEVESLIAWCGRGPSGARVTGVETRDEPPGGGESFDIVG